MASGGAGKSRGGGGLGGSVGLDGDELALIIALVVLIAGICGSSLYLIYEAPSILAEAAFETSQPARAPAAGRGVRP